MARRAAPVRAALAGLVWLYRRSGGRIHGRLFGLEVLLLTHRGRRSGREMTTPLAFGRDGDAYVLIASNGGSDENPAWYLNLKANPDAEVEIGPRRLRVRAEELPPGPEKERLYRQLGEVYNGYYGYRRRTRREIPVLRLRPVE
ncbi:MAG TPA: nitroreductase/quinone reductase family protein [Candidatus Acidoferrales bacterium]|nr:nitroreductase/quinone reductase family protein [Candidatus Acidoferrales bacterium]